MKRFTETTKWTDKWFRQLTPGQKLVFMYLTDNCDCAGFYELDAGMMAFQIGISDEQVDAALKGLARCYETSDDGAWIWIKNFLKHQRNLPLNPANRAHTGIMQCMLEQQDKFSEQGAFKALIRGYGNGIGSGNTNNDDEEKPKRAGFTKPTVEEVTEYVNEKNYAVDPGAFMDWCETNGWKLSNGNSMKNWRSAVSQWNRRERGTSQPDLLTQGNQFKRSPE